MKKSLLALLLCLVMVLSIVLTSCGETTKVKDPAETGEDGKEIQALDTSTKMTVTLYSITDDDTTDEQVKLVEDAFNAITESKLNTHVTLRLFKESEYDDKIDGLVNKIKEDRLAAEKAEQERMEAEKQALINGEELPEEEKVVENTQTDTRGYPIAKEDQLDIFLVRDFKYYYKLARGENLAAMDEELAANCKLLSSYVYPSILTAANVEGETFGIFNNTVLGDYEYLLLNKELVDKYSYDPEEMKNLETIKYFLEDVKQNEAGVIPFLGDIEAPIISFTDEPSLLGAYLGDELNSAGKIDAVKKVPKDNVPKNILNTSAFTEWATTYNSLFRQGCIVEETAENKSAKFAAKVIKGDVTLSPTFASQYDNYKTDELGFKYITYEDGVDYYVSVYKRPIAQNDTVFGAGYVISSSANEKIVSRCMQVITLLNTDEKLANLFTYGIEGTHYTIDEKTQAVHKKNNGYSMNFRYTGNIYLLKQSDDMDEYWKFMSDDNWKNAKNTNQESMASPYLGLYFNPEEYPSMFFENEEREYEKTDLSFKAALEQIVRMSEGYIKETITNTTEADFEEYYRGRKSAIGSDPAMSSIVNTKGKYYIGQDYTDWYQLHFNTTIK